MAEIPLALVNCPVPLQFHHINRQGIFHAPTLKTRSAA